MTPDDPLTEYFERVIRELRRQGRWLLALMLVLLLGIIGMQTLRTRQQREVISVLHRIEARQDTILSLLRSPLSAVTQPSPLARQAGPTP